MSAKRTADAISDRRAATIIGVLYIIGTAAGVAGLTIMPSFAAGTDILAQVAAHHTATVVAAILVLTMGLALAAIPAIFYPIGRRTSETLSMGYVIFRGALEGTLYIISAFIWLVLVAIATDSAAMAPVATMLQTAHRLIYEQLIALPFAIGAFMFCFVLYRARLVPNWLSIWGLGGAVLYFAAPLARLAGLDLDMLMGPLAVQEMVLAVWLIAKGFSPAAIAVAPASAGVPQPSVA